MNVTITAALLVSCGLGGCATVVMSTLVETSELSATYTVTVSEDGSHLASARFDTERYDVLLDSEHGDRVSIDGLDVPVKSNVDPVYETYAMPLGEHVFALQRGGAAPIEYRVGTPPPFVLTDVPAFGSYDTQNTLTWAPTVRGATVDVEARTDDPMCADAVLASGAPDTGSVTFGGAQLRPSATMPPACAFTVEVKRTTLANGAAPPLASVELRTSYKVSTKLTFR